MFIKVSFPFNQWFNKAENCEQKKKRAEKPLFTDYSNAFKFLSARGLGGAHALATAKARFYLASTVYLRTTDFI